MSTPYGIEIDRASKSMIPYRSGQATTLLQYPWHSSAILMSESFQDWIGQHESNEDMKDVIQVISVFFISISPNTLFSLWPQTWIFMRRLHYTIQDLQNSSGLSFA